MNDANTKPRKSWRRWFRFSLRSMLLAVAVVALVLGLVLHYRVHLIWRVGAWYGGFTDVEAIPVGPMPATPTPEDWKHCRFGSIEFDLPPQLTENLTAPENGATALVLYDDSRKVMIHLPRDQADLLAWQEETLGLPPQGQGLSLPRLRVACWEASFDDFRWSMSRQEVHWHLWRVTMSPMMQLSSGGTAETLFRDDLEGVARFTDNASFFDWQAENTTIGGSFLFEDSRDETDPNWMRSVCQSLRFSGECYPERMTREEVLALFEVVSE